MATIHKYQDIYTPEGISWCNEVEPTIKIRVQLIREALKPNSNVLDYGCGCGSVIGQVSREIPLGERSIGYDLNKNGIESARKKFPQLRFEVCELGIPLPEPDESFDAVISSEVAEHIVDTKWYFDQIYRLLRPGGLLIMTVPYHGLLKDITLALSGRFWNHYRNPYSEHIRFYTKRTLSFVLNNASFRVERILGIGRIAFLWRSIFVIARKVDVRQ